MVVFKVYGKFRVVPACNGRLSYTGMPLYRLAMLMQYAGLTLPTLRQVPGQLATLLTKGDFNRLCLSRGADKQQDKKSQCGKVLGHGYYSCWSAKASRRSWACLCIMCRANTWRWVSVIS